MSSLFNGRLGKTFLYIACDIVFMELALAAAVSLWYSGSIPGSHTTSVPTEAWQWFITVGIAAAVTCVIINSIFGMYNNLWKYASIDEVLKIFLSTTLVFIVLYIFDFVFLKNDALPLARRLLFVAWLFDTILFSFSRFGYRAIRRMVLFFGHLLSSKSGCKRVMIIGAGYSGYGVIRGLLHQKIRDKLPVIILDPDPTKDNTHIMGVRVISDVDRISEIAEKFHIDEIIIAMPSASPDDRKHIIDQCTQTECSLKILPPMSDVTDGVFDTKVRDVNISDLLYREEITLDNKNISDYLSNRIVLVTGGGGSIGSELIRQIAKFNPKQIVIVDIYENGAYALIRELEGVYKNKLNIVMRLGSVRDIERMDTIFAEYKPQVVFHAAAHKHVHFIEECPSEAVKNNIFGTRNVAVCADRHGVERFILISTDKAVKPTNVYGATKRVAELVVQSMAQHSKTKFMAVRFGNVLGSNGSIVPVWRQQIANGGPLTITHPDMERYLMTIPEACQLVLQASGLGKTGRIFVLDMGERVKILDLANNFIRLSGLRPGKDIQITYIGPRPGEKIYEELILDEEQDDKLVTCHMKIIMLKPVETDFAHFESQLKALYELSNEQIPKKLSEIVPQYIPE